MTQFHEEILAKPQLEALKSLAPALAPRGFYLVGGTAVALRLGHRRSIDLDWFSPDVIPDPLALAADLKAAGVPIEVVALAPNTLHAAVAGVKVSLMTYRYPLLFPLNSWPEIGCMLASLEDLSCMKLVAVAQRGSRKDFLDIAALGRAGYTLTPLLEWFMQKYGVRDVGYILVGLCYFDDADREPSPICLDGADWNATKATIRGWVKDYVAATSKQDRKG